MARDPYRNPASVAPDPSNHERMLARVRSRRSQQPQRRQPSDAFAYDRESLRGDAMALTAGFVALILLAAGAVLLIVYLMARAV